MGCSDLQAWIMAARFVGVGFVGVGEVEKFAMDDFFLLFFRV